MPAPEGNQNALKFPTPEDRKKLCADYIAHVESGLSDECFPDCDPQTLRKYIVDFPVDFDTNRMEVAKRKRQLFWEKVGRDGTIGEIKGFNSRSWQFNMGNRFGWKEKREYDVDDKRVSPAKELADAAYGVDESPKDDDTQADAPLAQQHSSATANPSGTHPEVVPGVLPGHTENADVSVSGTDSQSMSQ